MAKRRRADELLVAAGLADDADAAARAILAGEVFAGSRRIDKAGQLLADTAELRRTETSRFVSRGGYKLEHALDAFDIDVRGAVCLDAGCSTGGFTDCLLQRGARLVYAVDVGYGQLDWKLRNDPRVVVMERTNVRHVTPGSLDPAPRLIVADLSFVSVRSLLRPLVELAVAPWRVVALIKPQFEVGRSDLEKGIVVNAEARDAAVELVLEAIRDEGWQCSSAQLSPLRGAQGNYEYLVTFSGADAGAATAQLSSDES